MCNSKSSVPCIQFFSQRASRNLNKCIKPLQAVPDTKFTRFTWNNNGKIQRQNKPQNMNITTSNCYLVNQNITNYMHKRIKIRTSYMANIFMKVINKQSVAFMLVNSVRALWHMT